MSLLHAADADPMEFAIEALEARGGLVERDPASPLVLLPSDVASRLGVPEEFRVRVQATEGDVGVGFGTPLLERLVAEGRGISCWAEARLEIAPPRPAHVRAALGRFSVRNGLVEHGDFLPISGARYLVVVASYVAEADDRREGLVVVMAGVAGGTEPDPELRRALSLGTLNTALLPCSSGPAKTAALERWLLPRSERAVREATTCFQSDVHRRYARERDRIAAYFRDMVQEARSPRRRTDPAAVQARVQHLLDERDAKLRDLAQRFTSRVSVSVVAVLQVEVPAVCVQTTFKRRKASRPVQLWLPAAAQEVDALGCEACGMPTCRPALCDDRLHLLCSECVPQAQGRVACPACRLGDKTMGGSGHGRFR